MNFSIQLQQPNREPDHHTITLDPAQFSSCDEDSSTSLSFDTGNSTHYQPTINTGSTDDKLLNSAGHGYLSPGSASEGALLAPTSRSISVTSFEGDPPDVEEDRDFYETEDLGGEMCMLYSGKQNTGGDHPSKGVINLQRGQSTEGLAHHNFVGPPKILPTKFWFDLLLR